MSDKTIEALTGVLAVGTDLIPISRSPYVTNYKVTAQSIANLAPITTSLPFSAITAAVNTVALVTSGSIMVSGSGIIQATQIWSVVVSSTPPSGGQVLTAATPTTANWQTPASSVIIAPRNIWSSGFSMTPVSASANTGPGGTNNEVWTYPFFLDLGTTVGHISQQVSVMTPQSFSCGIYSLDGTILYLQAMFAGNTNAYQTIAITPVTLQPGAYRFAFGLGGSTLTFSFGVSINPNVYNLGPVPYVALCGNPLNGDYTMPSSLGSFTAYGLTGWPSFLLQP